MKKLFSLLIILLLSSALNAQWVVESFDNAVKPNTSIGTNWADTAITNTNFYTNGPTAYTDLFNSADAKVGTGSMLVKYRIEAFDGWGGYTVRTNYHETDIASVPYLDLSSGTELSVWVKVTVPADTSQGGSVFMEFKLAEFDNENQREYYYYHVPIDFFDQSGEWVNVKMPLVQTSDNTTGFAVQSGGVDDILQFDRVKGFEMAMVYITGGNQDNPPSAVGEFQMDNLQLIGQRYGAIESFDNSASTWGVDEMSWNAIPGDVTLTDENTDFVEGTGALKMDFTLSAPEVWGGFVAIDKEVTVHDSMAERTALVLYMKNLVAMATDSARGFMRVFVFENDNETAATEEWIIDPGIDLSVVTDWTHYHLPLVRKDMGVNDRFPPKDGFALKNGAGDGSLNPAAIFKIRIEPFGRGTEDGYSGALLAQGSLLIDVMQTSGFQIADFIAPEAPAVAVVEGTYSNLVTWTDVPHESGEKYNVYASESPITDVTAAGVERIGTGIAENVQVVEHPIISGRIDREKTFYYAVVCYDAKPNYSLPGVTGPITNLAKGIPVVSTNPPAFVADGDLTEWSGVTPFSIKLSDGTAHPVLTVTDDADCSADCYVALDADYLYVAMEITDDVVNHDPALQSYENDAPDLFIGLYNLTDSHVGYLHGATPDYHLRFGKFLARNDQNDSAFDSLLVAGTENYAWVERAFPSGYTLEAKISLVDLATKRNLETAIVDEPITWEAGYKVPFDFGVNDNDGALREGMIFYSAKNGDQGWQNVSVWAHTWIEDEIVGVEEIPMVSSKYSLDQNYPNPFNPSTKITYTIEKPGVVKIKVFDVLGRQVAELLNQQQNTGSYEVDFNGSDLSSGLYFYSIETGSFKATKKMMLLK
ncbi:MAG: T9SS type A sorting domain-containing protein [Ignavibacteriae bacterium]|nr:T9SS type A sorting domain-containing protein [Ignavibacteriota bacterium]